MHLQTVQRRALTAVQGVLPRYLPQLTVNNAASDSTTQSKGLRAVPLPMLEKLY
jgi:hypothetical protein